MATSAALGLGILGSVTGAIVMDDPLWQLGDAQTVWVLLGEWAGQCMFCSLAIAMCLTLVLAR